MEFIFVFRRSQSAEYPMPAQLSGAVVYAFEVLASQETMKRTSCQDIGIPDHFWPNDLKTFISIGNGPGIMKTSSNLRNFIACVCIMGLAAAKSYDTAPYCWFHSQAHLCVVTRVSWITSVLIIG